MAFVAGIRETEIVKAFGVLESVFGGIELWVSFGCQGHVHGGKIHGASI